MQFQGNGQSIPQSGEGLPQGTPPVAPQGLDPSLETAPNPDVARGAQQRLAQKYDQQQSNSNQQQPPPQQEQQGQQDQPKTYTQEQWADFQRIKDKEVSDARRQMDAQQRIAQQMEERVQSLQQQHQQMSSQWANYQAQQMDPEQRAAFFQQQQQLTEQQYRQQMEDIEQREQMRQMKWRMANEYDIPITELVSDDYGKDSQYVMQTLNERWKSAEERANKAESALAAYRRGEQAADSVYPGENKSPPQTNTWQARYEQALQQVMQNKAPTSLVDEVRHGAHMAGVQLDFQAAERLSIGY